jgi:ribonuclease HII|tara:strand:+ start:823 stop:1428 length:606 start_codon:yes stop_codon:yes gene_type:complete
LKFDPQKLIAFENNFSLPIAGIDEVGRGPLAGPVIAAAVILDRKNIPEGINDSKKIPKAKRILLAEKIKENSIYAYGAASEIEIDEINILQASLLAMKRASDGLSVVPKTTLIDGNFKPDIKNNTISIIKGDSKSVSIAAASILAKVYRDEIMLKYSKQFPEYGFQTNSGYGTKEHLSALKNYGITPIHRKSFKPVHNILN